MKQKEKTIWKRWYMIVVYCFVGLIIIAFLLDAKNDNFSSDSLADKTKIENNSFLGIKYSDLSINEKDSVCREIESKYNNCLKDYSTSYCNEKFGEFGIKVLANHKIYEQEERLKMVNYCYP